MTKSEGYKYIKSNQMTMSIVVTINHNQVRVQVKSQSQLKDYDKSVLR